MREHGRVMPKAAKPARDEDPDRLVRQTDGGYATPDARFVVEQANGSWFLADQETADDFGQPRVAGPFSTLKLVKEAIPRVRSGPTPMRKPVKQTKASGTAKAAKPARPETWLDRLSPDERRRAEKVIRTLTKEGIDDADALATAHFAGGAAGRGLAKRILLARLDRALAAADDDARAAVTDAVAVLSGSGRIGAGLPGWALVETDADGAPTDRLIELD
jgi:hypothetical protein